MPCSQPLCALVHILALMHHVGMAAEMSPFSVSARPGLVCEEQYFHSHTPNIHRAKVVLVVQ